MQEDDITNMVNISAQETVNSANNLRIKLVV